MLLKALMEKKGIGLQLLETLRSQKDKSILGSEFLKKKKILSGTLKYHNDLLEKLGLIENEVLRNVTGRPNKISLTKKGEKVIDLLTKLQKILEEGKKDNTIN